MTSETQRRTVTLGTSLNGPASEKYVALRYSFQPGTMDRSKSSTLKSNKGEFTLTVPNTILDGADHVFKGAQQAQKDVDCVLIYDEHTQSYRLERLDSLIRLDHQRQGNGPRKTASTASTSTAPPVPVIEDEDDDDEGLDELANMLESRLDEDTKSPVAVTKSHRQIEESSEDET